MPPIPGSDNYELLPTAEGGDLDKSHESQKRRVPRGKHIVSRVLGLACFLFLAWHGMLRLVKFVDQQFQTKACHYSLQRNLSSLPSHFALPSGDSIPSVALGMTSTLREDGPAGLYSSPLGVWKAMPGEVGPAVKAALQAGYRHIDGAWAYRVRVG